MRMMSPEPCMRSLSRFVRLVESRGDSGECSRARVLFPTLGRQVRSAAITEIQKRIGSLSDASSESQAKAGSRPAARLLGASRKETVQAERRVVFPLPAEAETSVKGCVWTASSSLSKRGRSTKEIGSCGGASLLASSEVFADAREAGDWELASSCATSSKRANVTWAVRPR